jgi:hypothetical protein
VVDALARAGVEAETAVWSDPAVDWSAYGLVVANGAWDNIHRVDEFLAWADAVGATTTLVNSAATLRWNMDKRYLRDLEAAGVPVVPTRWVEPGAAPGDPSSLAFGGGEVVVKPSVSGGGHHTARYEVHEREAARAHVAALVGSGRTAMIQPYQPAVDAEGEVNLVFLGGTFSHAVHKDPLIRRGAGSLEDLIDNLVVTAGTATAAHLAVAKRALRAAEELCGPTAYARADIVRRSDGELALLELELLDPMLFFRHHPEGATMFADALAALGALAGPAGLDRPVRRDPGA